MTREKIEAVVSFYRRQFEERNIPKKQMDPHRTLGTLSSEQRLAHAHFLLDGIIEYAADPEKAGKTGRHLASVQMILSFENWYTLEELMEDNRPDSEKFDEDRPGMFWAECHCLCHGSNGEIRANHIMACCSQCPWCQMNVVGDLGAHIQEKHPECVGHAVPFLPLDVG